MEWIKDALCAEIGSDLFFQEEDEPNNWKSAKKVCSLCSVKYECLEYAIEMNVEGVWGGTTKRERMQIKKQRSAA